jgi:hypothetical protein
VLLLLPPVLPDCDGAAPVVIVALFPVEEVVEEVDAGTDVVELLLEELLLLVVPVVSVVEEDAGIVVVEVPSEELLLVVDVPREELLLLVEAAFDDELVVTACTEMVDVDVDEALLLVVVVALLELVLVPDVEEVLNTGPVEVEVLVVGSKLTYID